MNNNLCIAVCENYRAEIETVLNCDEFQDIHPMIFPSACGSYPLTIENFTKNFDASAYSEVCIVGGSCIRFSGNSPSSASLPPPLFEKERGLGGEFRNIFTEMKANCFYLFANQDIVDYFIQEGSYVTTPGWLSAWHYYIKEKWGFDRQTAITFFKEFARQVLLLDTKVDPKASEHLRDMADFIEIPYKIFPVGLDVFREIIKAIVYKWRLEKEKKNAAARLSDSNRRIADYAMLYNMLSKISAIKSENEVIAGILELFTILCAPSQLLYLALIDGQTGGIQSAGFLPANSQDEIQKMLQVHSEYEDSQNGFYLRISHIDDTVGILKVDGFAFPEYKQHYLNIAHTIGKVCGLAIDNARKYMKLEQAKEEMNKARESANAANQAKSEFLSNMSHELRTPLNGILGYAQILKREDSLTESQKAGIDVIERSGKHLLNLINEILDLSKIEARKMEIHESGILFREFLFDLSKIIQVQAEQKQISFHAEIDSNLPKAVQSDEKRLSQILLNLLGNAVKFTQKGDIVLRVSKTSGTNMIHFEIEDTGIGIPEAHLEDIFSPFKQVGLHTRTVEGTGLGLTISRKLVRLMGGELYVKSIVGKGSKFWFDIDLPETSVWTESKESDEKHIIGYIRLNPEKKGKIKLLVIDDRWENRVVMVNMLLPLGFELLEANDGEEGLLKASEFMPDLIFMDLVMPVMDGFEATRRIRNSSDLNHIKVIAVSASSTLSAQEIISKSNFDNFLSKPVHIDQIFKVLEKYLELKWVYKTPVKPVNSKHLQVQSKAFIAPPLPEIKTLLNLARGGDIMRIRNQLDHLEQSDERYIPFTTEVRKLAGTFQIKQIRELMEKHIGDGG